MKKMSMICAAAALGAGTVLALATPARAATCASYPNPVYIAGSSAVQPLLQTIAGPLGQATPPVSIIYQSVGSCVGVSDITTPTSEVATANYIDPTTGTLTACTFPATGIPLDIGVSDVFPATCGVTLPSGQTDFHGPNQVMTYVVPKGSSESSISADAAYTVFGFGGTTYTVAPWTDPAYYFIRKPTSGVINMLAGACLTQGCSGGNGLATTKWKGVQEANGSNGVLADLTGLGATQPGKSIGILATDLADGNRSTIKILAYQASGQTCGYLPDSSSTSFDKINVRQGRYGVWGPLHLIANVGAGGTPTSAAAAALISYFTGTGITTPQAKLVLDAEVKAHVVPQCAMQVSRATEDGPTASYQPDVPCGCYYESSVGGASASCKTCPNGDGDCAATPSTPKCRYGYCEAK